MTKESSNLDQMSTDVNDVDVSDEERIWINCRQGNCVSSLAQRHWRSVVRGAWQRGVEFAP